MKPTKKAKSDILSSDINIGGVNLAQKAVFARNLAIMLRAGISIGEALEIIFDSITGKFKKVVYGVWQSVEAGQSLSNSLASYPKIFSGLFKSAVYIGEESGTLSENLNNVANQLDKDKEMRAKVSGAILYPAVVLVAAIILGLVVAFVVLPKIVPLFEGLKIKLPLSTRVLIWLSNVVQAHGILIIVSLLVAVTALIWASRQKFSRPLTHWLLLNFPLIKRISINFNLSRFCRTLGMLLQSGLSIDEAIKVTGESLGNYYYHRSLFGVYEGIGKGSTLAENLAIYKKLYPVMLIRMVMVGEKSGKLEESLFYLADYYEREVDNDTKSLATSIEPILLIFIGLVVGFLAISIITPIYSVTSGIKN
jgi:type II secretory pathway component PulF